jgi:Mycothiol maleylpyruvate isomerase N-terminal domain
MDRALVLESVERSWAALDEFLGELSDAQMGSAGLDGWSVKDHLAHIAAWNLSLAALLERRHRQAAMALEGFSTTDWDGQNEVLRRRYRGLVPGEVRALLLGSCLMVVDALRGLSDADLMHPYREFQPQDTRTTFPTSDHPVWMWVVGSAEMHVDEHLQHIRLITGSPAVAVGPR